MPELAVGDENYTPLNMCVQYNGNVETARLLLEKDSSVIDIPDKQSQNSPLHNAAKNENLESMKIRKF